MSRAQTITAYVGLGSNLEDPRGQVCRALDELGSLPGSRLVARSPLYCSAPMGPADQPSYINAVAALDTALAPEALLTELQRLEHAHGRVRNGTRWGPRTLDLDLLLHGHHTLQTPRLQLPHPGLTLRAFVLYPLADVAPDLVLPDGTPLANLLAHCPPTDLERLADPC